MFGGIAFLVDRNLAISANGQGGILVRVDPAESERLVARTKATVAQTGGRRMTGWLRLSPEEVRTKPQLPKWVASGTTYARSLPAKR